jgi:diacylglycerol kinase (ATP)
MKRALVILNPASGQHEAEDSRCAIEDVLQQHGITHNVCQTRAAKDAFRWARDASPDEYDVVIAAGGDGTIVEAMNGLLTAKSSLPLLPVPLGTANGLARALSLPLSMREALEAALAGEVAHLDVGHVVNHDHYFLLFAGAGYDAKVIRVADREQKNKYGFMAYIYAALKLLKRQRNQFITLELDGKKLTVFAHSVLLFNASAFEIAGVPVGPKANPKDGKLELVILRDPSVWGTLRELWNVLTHRLSNKPPQFLEASRLRLETQRPLPFQSDGDVLGETPLEIEVKAAAAKFVVPRTYLARNVADLEEPISTVPLFPEPYAQQPSFSDTKTV